MVTIRNIGVFGRGDVSSESQEYRQAVVMGRLLSESGYTVVNGGYGGIMEAVSRGASESGGKVLGVISDVFPGRSPNKYLTSTIGSATLFERTEHLINNSDAFIALSPRTGTAWEVITLLTLRKAGLIEQVPLILVGHPWKDLVVDLGKLAVVDDFLLKWPACVSSPEEALDILNSLIVAEKAE